MKTISNTFTVNTVIDGDDAAIAFATPAQISIPCYSNGNVKAQKITSVTFSLKVGTNTATVTSCAVGTKPTGVTVQGQANNAVTITVGTSATASGLSTGVTFTVTGTYGGKTYSATITVALIGLTQGEQGERGKVGRFFYFGGTFNAADTTQTFIVNDAQAPYFEHSETVTTQSGTTTIKRYHVFNYDTNGTYTMAQMWAIRNNWNYKPWEIMTNDFKYIITEALFGSYAHLGSWIFNGDYMLSQAGVDGTENYTQFTGEGSTWQPNLYMNAKTGKLVANSGVIGGFTINASQIKSSNNNIILNSDGSAKIGVLSVSTSGTSIEGDLKVSSDNGSYFVLKPSNSQDAHIVAYNNSGTKELIDLGIRVTGGVSRPTVFVQAEDELKNVSVDPYQISFWGNINNRLSTLDSGIEYMGSLTQYYANYNTNMWKEVTIGVRQGNVILRAHDDNGDSAWPEYNYMLDPTTLDKGSVQILSLGALKQILDDSSTYWDRLQKLCVLIVRNI